MKAFPLAALAVVLSLPAAAQEDCPPCPEGTRELTLLVGSREFIAPGQTMHLSAVHSEFASGAPTSGERDDVWVSSPQELRREVLGFARRCRRIKYMMIATHGGPGWFGLGDGGEQASVLQLDANLERTLGGLSCALAPGATVKLSGCSVASRCEGENFVSVVAKQLLSRGGGLLEAERSDQNSLGGLTPTFGMRGSHKLRVAPGGRIEWERSPIPQQQCREKLSDAANSILAKARNCLGGANREAMDAARQLQEAVADLDASPDRFDAGTAALARYNAAVENAENVKKRNACLR
jgi:hypothetical protein